MCSHKNVMNVALSISITFLAYRYLPKRIHNKACIPLPLILPVIFSVYYTFSQCAAECAASLQSVNCFSGLVAAEAYMKN